MHTLNVSPPQTFRSTNPEPMNSQNFVVDRSENNHTLAAVLKRRLGLSWSQARQLVERRQVRVNNQPAKDAASRLRPGQQVAILGTRQPGPRPAKRPPKPMGGPALEPPRRVDPPINLIHVDDHIVIVEKPSGLTTMRHAEEAAEFGERGQRFLPSTLADLLPRHLPGPNRMVRAVHRLDRDTSGLVAFARTADAEAHLGRQFRAHTIERLYRAVVRGVGTSGRVESVLVRDRGDGRRGTGASDDEEGQRAVTHVRVAESLGEFTLVECRLETGRTHQVRIHLGERGTPICGERLYDRPVNGSPVPDTSGSPRLALHAATLGLEHPATGERLTWESPLPADLRELVERLRRGAE